MLVVLLCVTGEGGPWQKMEQITPDYFAPYERTTCGINLSEPENIHVSNECSHSLEGSMYGA